jgi:sensor domain CHASE-containing protein
MVQKAQTSRMRKKIKTNVSTAIVWSILLLTALSSLPKKRQRKKEKFKNRIKRSLMATREDLDKESNVEEEKKKQT